MANEANNVTLNTNFNVAPYYDDFDESKNYHRILFRPGLAVQARELTQMQTILQNQIDRFASHIFQEGSTVQGLDMAFDSFYTYVKLRDSNSAGTSVDVNDFLNKELKGTSSGVRALVVNVAQGSEANTPNFKTLFVKYTAANTNGTKEFSNNEILTDFAGSALTCNTITSGQGGATGRGIAANFTGGIVYAKDHFVRVPAQTVILSKYDQKPNVRVGFDIAEEIVTEVTDTTLLDPAQGSYNYAAPGAARLKLTAEIISIPLTQTVSNTFVELMQVEGGVVQSISNRPQYSQIRDYMAERTSDESGDYIVQGFTLNVKEHLNDGTNQGIWTAAEGGNTYYLSAVVEPGKAYVKGYDISKITSSKITFQKAIDYESVEQAKGLADYGNYLIVDNVSGNWDVNQQVVVSLRSNQANSISTGNYSSTILPGVEIGKARVRGINYISGTPNTPDAKYKLHITDIQMNSGYGFNNVQSVGYNDGGGAVYGKADIYASTGTTNPGVYDSIFDRAIFRLPSVATKTLRDTDGNVNNDFAFYKSFNRTSSSAVFTVDTGDSSETFDGGGTTLSSTAQRSDFYVVCRTNTTTSNLTGTVSISSGANTVTQGSSTPNFTGQISVGDWITIGSSGDLLVTAVNATTLSVLQNSASTETNSTYIKKFKAGQVLDFAGKGANGDRSISISASPATVATLDLNETLSGGQIQADIICNLNKIDGQEANKVIQRNRLVQVRIGAGGGTSYTANSTGPWPLGLSDGFRLVSVRRKNGSNFTSTTEGVDVTNQFTLDTGGRDSFYSHAQLVRKPTTSAANTGDRFLVTLDHFTHTNRERGYFSVDSYPVDDVNAGSDTSKIFTYQIPVYISPKTGITYDLRDCVDFRPRLTDTANSVTTVTNISINPLVSNSFATATGGLHFSPTNEDFTTDLDYYLSRVDVIGMTKSGDIKVTRGNPSLKPIPPAVPNDTMAMASIKLAPYPSLPLNVARANGRPDQANRLRKFDNRRYTMRDIGKISSRIDRLEYYTTLNQLEKDAKDLLIPDESGLNRFKNGIMTDNFSSHGIGLVGSAEYKIAIDDKKGEARPRSQHNETPLHIHSSSSNVVRTNVTPSGVSRDQVITINELVTVDGWFAQDVVTAGSATATVRHAVGNKLYVENATANFAVGATITASGGKSATISAVSLTTPGDLVTLPYAHDIFTRQPFATTTRNCAGSFWTWRGNMLLFPDSDYWCDTVNAPDININLDLNTDAWTQMAATWPANWNAPITSFTGEPVLVGTSQADVGREYSVVQPDGSTIIYQDFATTSTYATPTLTTQTGTQNGVDVVTNTSTYGNVVVDTRILPFMRSRDIIFIAYNIKPESRLYAFFDNVNVSSYITPLTKAEFDSKLKTTNGAPISPAAAEGSALTSNASGIVYGRFRLPNDSTLQFRVGSKRLRLVDNPTNSKTFGQFTTSVEAVYTAEGLEQTNSTINVSTKSVEFTQTDLSRQNIGSSSSSTSTPGTRVVGVVEPPPDDNDNGGSCGCGGCGGDPIAQSMLVSSLTRTRVDTSGIYLTKLSLFFATKDSTLPVTVELREVDQLTGAVTNKTVPFSRVILQPSEVNTSEDGQAATPVVFPSPVYLTSDKEFAIVIIPGADNPNYTVYTAVLGENDISTGEAVSQQPASGFLFTSANQRTWVPVENEDLKFIAFYAVFDKSSQGELIVKNAKREYVTIEDSVGGTLSRVGEVVHGHTRLVGTFAPGSGLTGNVATSNSFVQGMTSGATGTIVSVSADHVVVRNVSTSAKFAGGEAVRFRLGANATHSPISGNSTGGITSATTPVGRVALYDNLNHVDAKLYIANVSYTNSGPRFANAVYFTAGSYLKGQSTGYQGIVSANGIYNIKADYLNLITNMILPSNNQVFAYAKMATSTSTIDSDYFRININGQNELNNSRYILSNAIESNTSASSSTMAANRSVTVKYVLDGRNAVASPAIDLRRITLYSAYNEINSSTEVSTSEENVAFGGNAQARYITKIVTLADGQDAEDLRVYLSAYKPPGTDVLLYYKIQSADDNETFDEKTWVAMERNVDSAYTGLSRYSSSQNRDDFLELVYDIPDYSASLGGLGGAGKDTSTGIVKYTATSGAVYSSFKYFALKIVLVSSNSANPPRITDLRAIALQV